MMNQDERRVRELAERLRRLNLTWRDLGLEVDFRHLRESAESMHIPFDRHLHDEFEARIAELETASMTQEFLSPTVSLEGGPVEFGTTDDGGAVGGTPGKDFNHILIMGSVFSGKSTFLAWLACVLLRIGSVVFIDSQNAAAKVATMRRLFDFASVRQLRLNPFDSVTGVELREIDLLMLSGMAESLSWQFAEQEASLALKELRLRGRADLYRLLELLWRLNYRPGSNRARYADTIKITTAHLLTDTHATLCCEVGMPLDRILTHSGLVLGVDHLRQRNVAWLCRYVIDYGRLLMRAGRLPSRPVFLCIDEAQQLLEQASVAETMMTLRHQRFHLVAGVQHPSRLLIQASGAADVIVVFRLIDQRDREHVGKMLNLTRQQTERLATLNRREAVCFMRRYPRAFILKVPHVDVDAAAGAVREATWIQELPWTPRAEAAVGGGQQGAETAPKAEAQAVRPKDEYSTLVERFVRDCVVEAFAFDRLSKRFERCAVRSGQVQRRIIRDVEQKGLVRFWSLSLGRGAPVKLSEALETAFGVTGVKRWVMGRGTFLTNAVTHYTCEAVRDLLTYRVDVNYRVDGKEVDVGIRDLANRLYTTEVAGMSGKHEVHNGLHCVRCANVQKHVVVCSSKKIEQEVKEAFAEHPDLAGSARVVVLTLARFIATCKDVLA